MEAVVKKADYQKDLILYETEDGDCGIFEIFVEAHQKILKENDVIIGIFDYSYGMSEITIEEIGETREIFVEEFGLSYADALDLYNKKISS